MIHFVGAGSGAEDLITLRGARHLEARVVLSYLLASIPAIGVVGIWWSIPIGWLLADLAGLLYYKKFKKQLLEQL